MRGRLEGVSDQSNQDPDLAPSCWFGMANIDRSIIVVFRSSGFHPVFANPSVHGFPFHAVCAKWLDAYFEQRAIPLVCLATYLLKTNENFYHKWGGDHLSCPDDADIPTTQGPYPRLKRPQFFVLARPDSLWWSDGWGGESIATLLDRQREENSEEPVDLADYDKGEQIFDGYTASLLALKRGTYEGAAEVVPLPVVPHISNDSMATAPPPPASSFTPDRLAHVVITTLLKHLPVHAQTGAIALLSCNRSWYLYGRGSAWRYFCSRDGFARVPTQRLSASLAECEARGVDWKRAYFCYESRNARRIARDLEFLAGRARRVLTRGVDENWRFRGQNPEVDAVWENEEPGASRVLG
ncbi:hypothetical protein DFJ73DRAFT_873087 [Zopfochytrium polystomum]|nr:hypothetical protein DFJ73DRAFT_873087 [Zopfochytrium polystomum]